MVEGTTNEMLRRGEINSVALDGWKQWKDTMLAPPLAPIGDNHELEAILPSRRPSGMAREDPARVGTGKAQAVW